MNRTKLAVKLFNPNEKGVSRWVCKSECVGEFSDLMPTNGNMWYRNKGIGGTYKWELKKVDGKVYWRFNGFNVIEESRPINPNIRAKLLTNDSICAHTGYSSVSNDKLVIDHKNGSYNDERVLNTSTQVIEDFQVLSNRANLKKRSDCGKCKNTGLKFDATTIGYLKPVCSGSVEYDGSCEGCYWNDPIKFKSSI